MEKDSNFFRKNYADKKDFSQMPKNRSSTNMEQSSTIIEAPKKKKIAYRRELIPLWIKVGCWVFMLLGVLVPFAAAYGFMGHDFDMAIYGITTDEPTSKVGLLIFAFFIYKAVVGYALWTEKIWAINIGKADAAMGAVICAAMIAIPYFTYNEEMKAQTPQLMLQLMPSLFFFKALGEMELVWETRRGRNSFR